MDRPTRPDSSLMRPPTPRLRSRGAITSTIPIGCFVVFLTRRVIYNLSHAKLQQQKQENAAGW